MRRIFVVEDSESINRLLCMALTTAGYEVHSALDGNEAQKIIDSGEQFDLALLDIMLPGMDGFQLLEPLQSRNIPVIYLTAKNDVESKVKGLKNGAEDYIVKPFDILELLVRIEKVLERHKSNDRVITVGNLVIFTDEHVVLQDGNSIQLSPILYDLLLLFAKNRNLAVPRERILRDVWGNLYIGESRTIDIHVSQLRKKTGLNIRCIPKIGYRLEV